MTLGRVQGRDLTADGAIIDSLKSSATVVTANNAITTTSTGHTVATSMTITPAAGTYLVFWSATTSTNSSTNRQTFIQIHVAGVAQGSEHGVERGDSSTDNRIGACCFAKVSVNGSQAIEGRWRTIGSTGEMYGRSLAILRVGTQ